jgi:Fatty acid hydroxylase superfamily
MDREQPTAYTTAGLQLRGAVGIFAAQANPRVIAVMSVAALTTRVVLARWTVGDLLVASVILALEPFTEWVTHVTVLHLRPVTVRGRSLELHIARRHRLHHMDPKRIKHVLIPQGVLLRLVVFAVPLYYLVTPTLRQALTGLVTSYAMLLTYEWTHFLIHSTYVPRSRYYRYIWRAHRLHHYKNEKYWFGVTVHLADHVLHTFPQRDAVETSKTCQTLARV